MQGLVCDMCSGNLLVDSDVRYLVKIEVFAAYDPLEIMPDDLRRDFDKDMGDLIGQMKDMDPGELQDQVHRKFEFDLCPVCQRLYLRDPLGMKRALEERGDDDED